jgi:hypothetical protein
LIVSPKAVQPKDHSLQIPEDALKVQNGCTISQGIGKKFGGHRFKGIHLDERKQMTKFELMSIQESCLQDRVRTRGGQFDKQPSGSLFPTRNVQNTQDSLMIESQIEKELPSLQSRGGGRSKLQ